MGIMSKKSQDLLIGAVGVGVALAAAPFMDPLAYKEMLDNPRLVVAGLFGYFVFLVIVLWRAIRKE